LYVPAAALSKVASRVVLELPEQGAFERVDGLAERLERLRDVGFRIALDDLGTGSAGTGLFKSLDPEFVKLDISLIRGIHRDPSRQNIVRSMVHVCHDLGKRLIAEGVETLEEQAVLREFECDFLQGYLLGKPERLSCEPSEHVRSA
jgi:EAL domain-containing protein (putative c-di-GMP-specific phosphodiesterase class I)